MVKGAENVYMIRRDSKWSGAGRLTETLLTWVMCSPQDQPYRGRWSDGAGTGPGGSEPSTVP